MHKGMLAPQKHIHGQHMSDEFPLFTYGRRNQKMARAVHHANLLFRLGQSGIAISILKKHEVPFHVVERVLLHRGPTRRLIQWQAPRAVSI